MWKLRYIAFTIKPKSKPEPSVTSYQSKTHQRKARPLRHQRANHRTLAHLDKRGNQPKHKQKEVSYHIRI